MREPPISFVFFTSPVEYEKLKALYPRHFPLTYEQFVADVEHTSETGARSGISVRKTSGSAEELVAHCRASGTEPDDDAQVDYAFAVGYRRSLN